MARTTTESMILNEATTARQVADYLARHGVAVGEVSEEDEDVDGEIALAGGYHVQVGAGYAILVRVEEGPDPVFIHGKTRGNARSILKDIAEAGL